MAVLLKQQLLALLIYSQPQENNGMDLECSNAMKGMCVQVTWAKVLARKALFNLKQTPPPPPTPHFEPLPPFFFLKVESPTVCNSQVLQVKKFEKI